MNRTWLNNSGNNKCILFFNGWGMDINSVNHLDFVDFDVVMFNQFDSNFNIENEFKKYKSIYVVAWSLGVWNSYIALNNVEFNINKAIAINGTLDPINEQYGIDPTIFNLTLETWNDVNREKFNMRMFGGRSLYKQRIKYLSQRGSIEQKEELANIRIEISKKHSSNLIFDTAIIGANDLIFLAKNQLLFWHGQARVKNMDFSHFPFADFSSWKQIVDL